MFSVTALLMMITGTLADTCQNIAGNYYCDQTSLVQFENVGFSGSYNRVTSFNSDGSCSSEPFSFSGPLAPFDEELSVHFRGPIQLENFKVFYGSSTGSKKKRALHHRHANPEPVIVTATNYFTQFVTVDQNGNPITEEAEAPAAAAPTTTSSSSSTSPTTTTSSTSTSPAAQQETSTTTSPSVNNYNFNHQDQSSATGPSVITTSTTSAAAQTPSSSSNSNSGSSWTLVSSYSAGSGSADGLVFLNNLGGSGSGIFDFQHGNSLSYCASNGVSAASNPEVLSQTVVPSNNEYIIFSDTKCNGNDCGYYRPGTVAYHGFGGARKVFVFEFAMPRDYTAVGFNADMPAVWLLNAQIPRTLQYGTDSCSCWKSGCGELDLWEILNSGNEFLTTTLHDKQNGAGGGTADYFKRPVEGTLKGAAVFDGTTITVVEIDEIPDSIDDSTIQSWISNAGKASVVNL